MNCIHWYAVCILLMAASASPLSAQTASYCNGPACTSNSYQTFTTAASHQQPTSSWSSTAAPVNYQQYVQTDAYNASPSGGYIPTNQVVYASQPQAAVTYNSPPMYNSVPSNQYVSTGCVAATTYSPYSQPVAMSQPAYASNPVQYGTMIQNGAVVQNGNVSYGAASNSYCGTCNNQPVAYHQAPVVQQQYSAQSPVASSSYIPATRQYMTNAQPVYRTNGNVQYASRNVGGSYGGGGLAQNKAQQAASRGLKGHVGGGLGNARYEGVGWSTASPQNAVQNCCYWGNRPVAQIGVARGNDGWYACVLYQ